MKYVATNSGLHGNKVLSYSAVLWFEGMTEKGLTARQRVHTHTS